MAEVPETLFGLVQRFSPTGQEGQAVQWLVERMHMLQFEQSFADAAGNAVGIKGSGPNQIVLLGHIDTVKGEIPVRVEGDTLYGRGSVDAKGPLASFVDAVAGIQVAPDWQVVVIGAVDEEGDSKGAKAIIDQYQPQFAIIGEPSQWNRVTLGYKGSQPAVLTCKKSLMHSSQGGNANDLLLEAWRTLLERVQAFNQDKPMFDQLNPTVLQMSTSSDHYEMEAKLVCGTRLPQTISPQDWLDEWLGAIPGVEVNSLMSGIPAYQAEKSSPLTRAFLKGIRAADGKPAFVNKSGTADINLVAPVWGCPAVAYGPGDSNLDHTPHEHQVLGDYRKSVQVLVEVLSALGIAA